MTVEKNKLSSTGRNLKQTLVQDGKPFAFACCNPLAEGNNILDQKARRVISQTLRTAATCKELENDKQAKNVQGQADQAKPFFDIPFRDDEEIEII